MNDFEKMERAFDREYTRKEEMRLALNIKDELDRNRPKNEDFEGIYSKEEISADNAKIDRYLSERKKKNQERNDERGLKDGLVLEGIFCRVDEVDLFCEFSDERYDYLSVDDNDSAIQAFPAHEYDDTFNNTDIYCTLCNTDTDHRPIIFSVDCTTNSSKVSDKMGYIRRPLEIRGTTCAKYFRDTQQNNPDLVFPTGQIDAMPRFVVGCDKEEPSELAKFLYGYKDVDDSEKYDRKKRPQSYEHSLGYVRSCIITELHEQAKANLIYLEKQAAVNPSSELEAMIDAYTRLDRYFSNTLDYLSKQGELYGTQFDSVCQNVHNACQTLNA